MKTQILHLPKKYLSIQPIKCLGEEKKNKGQLSDVENIGFAEQSSQLIRWAV